MHVFWFYVLCLSCGQSEFMVVFLVLICGMFEALSFLVLWLFLIFL